MSKVLVIGALGQVGTELLSGLRAHHGHDQVIGSDIRMPEEDLSPFETLDVMDMDACKEIIQKHNVTEVYHLAALLSATAEQKPLFGWELNMKGLFNILELAKNGLIEKVFWPSSIAVFGPSTPRENTPQHTITDPNTVYGISKLAGERWCEYYHAKYDVDVRSVRYPGLIGYKSLPGGGTTDYAVDIFHKAKANEHFECFLSEDAALPMMYMEDAINATISIMNAPVSQIKIRSSYNISGISFAPGEIYEAIKVYKPEFQISYNPDFREQIARSWPASLNDDEARSDWGWNPKYDLDLLVQTMLANV